MSERRAFVCEAELELAEGTDTRAPGGAVTMALCGSWEHDGPCRWPHHSTIDDSRAPALLRTVFAVGRGEEREVGERIAEALRSDGRWRLLRLAEVPPAGDELHVGRCLCARPEV